MLQDLPIVVLSHLRWDFVYQRPQHLLSRLANGRRVLFIEEPFHNDQAAPHWEITNPERNVSVARPHMNIRSHGFGDEQMPTLSPMVHSLLESEGLHDYVLWLYTPMAYPLARTLNPSAVVYDCMDELSAFKMAPPKLRQHEADLMRWADVVFTGGPSLYRAKQGRHPNLHCFPSSVDTAHFEQARSIPEASDIAGLPHPRLGFYGVIDERMDLDLIDTLARSHPEWQIVMVGPVVKIDPTTLPQHPNLQYSGGRGYNELPSYLAGWDVCLLPFALNESTRFISPTKTLEYMAAGLPVVSTPITDVAEPYGDIVYLGATPEEFVAACEQALAAPGEETAQRKALGRAVLSQTSWDSTVAQMERLISEAIKTRRRNQAAARSKSFNHNYMTMDHS